MKKLLTAIFCVSLLSATISLPVACSNVTKEAKTYNTFRTTWALAFNAYKGWAERVVQGRIGKAEELSVDKAWNDFRLSFSLSMSVAKQNWNAVTPADLDKLQKDFVALVTRLSNNKPVLTPKPKAPQP